MLLFFFMLGRILQKAQGPVVSNRIGMKFSRNVVQVNTHRLTESDLRFDVTLMRWRPWRHFTQQSAATRRVNMKRPPGPIYSVRQFLIYSTFVLVICVPTQMPDMRLRHQRRLAIAMTAMVVVSTVTWLPLGIAPLALMMGRAGDAGTEGRWLLLVAIVAQSSVVSAPLMHVAGGKNLRRRAIAFFFCHGQKVGTVLWWTVRLDVPSKPGTTKPGPLTP